MLDEILKKSLQGEIVSPEEIAYLFEVPLFSEGSAKIIAASRWKASGRLAGTTRVIEMACQTRALLFCSIREKTGRLTG
jgi:hypothetical protein